MKPKTNKKTFGSYLTENALHSYEKDQCFLCYSRRQVL